jgi:hypothetical protein
MATHNLNWLLAFPGRILRFDDNEIREVKNLDNIDTVKVKVIADNNSIMEETVVVDDDE